MGYTYTPAYYSSLQDSISSICKSILPFSLKKRRLTAAEQKLSKQQSDNLKWQQTSFHHILNLMGLHKEGILPASELASFRSHLLDTLIASKGPTFEQPQVLRDKLLFLQELLYAKCISEDEYHASKRPLIQRLAVQGVEIEATDVIVAVQKESPQPSEEQEEWSTIDLRDDQSSANKRSSGSKSRLKNGTSSAMKHIKDSASVFGLGSLQKLGRNRQQKSIFDREADNLRCPAANAEIPGNENVPTGEGSFLDDHRIGNDSETNSILMSENLGSNSEKVGDGAQGGKRKPLQGLFPKKVKEVIDTAVKPKEKQQKSARKQWGFDGFKRWKSTNLEDETTPLPLGKKSGDGEDYKTSSELAASPVGEAPDIKQIKRKLLSDSSSSGFIIDKVLEHKIREELSRIQTKLTSKNPDFQLSDDQIDAIATKLPADKSDLNQILPKSWCDHYGDVVLDAVKKELKDHLGENENMRNATLERRHTSSKRWTTFDADENCHPNLFAGQSNKKSTFFPDQNPFWNGSPI